MSLLAIEIVRAEFDECLFIESGPAASGKLVDTADRSVADLWLCCNLCQGYLSICCIHKFIA